MNGVVNQQQAEITERLLDCRILVVDDTEFNRMVISAMLEDVGYRNIAFARDGFEALDAVAADKPDLILLDIMMPGMDGFEVCSRLRAQYDNAELPILVQTALSSMDDRNRAFEAGTTDLVSKPIERQELLARVRIHLENRMLVRSQRAYRERVEGELTIAKGMYEHLTPTPLQCQWLQQETGVRLLSHTRLSSDLGGVIWGAAPLAKGRLAVYVLNVVGTGLSAALNAFRMHTLVHELKHLGEMPAAFLAALNARAATLLEPEDRVRVLFGVVDAANDTFVYASAGGLPPRVAGADVDPDGAENHGFAGPEVGVAPDTIYRTRRASFCKGDVLVLENRRLSSMKAQDAGQADLVAMAMADGLEEGAADAAFNSLCRSINDLDNGDFAEDHLIVWLDRAAGFNVEDP